MDLGDFSSLLLQSVLSPSITSVCILLLIALQLGFSRLRTDHVLALQFRVALVFTALGILVALGMVLGIDLAGSLSGTGSAETAVAILLAFTGVACLQRSYVVACWLVLVLLLLGKSVRENSDLELLSESKQLGITMQHIGDDARMTFSA